MISCRTKLFKVSPSAEEGVFDGGDFAKWLGGKLAGWETDIIEEDWGWAATAQKTGYDYIFGIYDHDTLDVTNLGPKWVIRLYNQSDKSNWFKRLFKYIPPKAHEEIVNEIVGILKSEEAIKDI
jgi:hypothetical protein